MAVSEEQKNVVLDELLQQLPLMDVDAIKAEFVGWLQQVEFPLGKIENIAEKSLDNIEDKTGGWSKSIKVFPTVEEDRSLIKGIKVRLSLQLYTEKNRYLITIWESMNPKSREHYILCVNVNWDETELRLQKNLETIYTGRFNRSLRAQHTIWAQNFQAGQLGEGLDAAAVAILSYELKSDPPEPAQELKIEISNIHPTNLPEKEL